MSFEETLSALGELVQQGKIRHFGVSNETAWGVSQFLRGAEAGAGPRLVSIQNAYHLLNRQFELGLAEFAFREQVGLLAYSPLAQGYLTGKYLHGARPPGARSTLFDRGQRYQKPGVDEAIEDYLALAQEFGLHPVHLALAFVTSRPFVTANIIGATNLEQLKLILDAPACARSGHRAAHRRHPSDSRQPGAVTGDALEKAKFILQSDSERADTKPLRVRTGSPGLRAFRKSAAIAAALACFALAFPTQAPAALSLVMPAGAQFGLRRGPAGLQRISRPV